MEGHEESNPLINVRIRNVHIKVGASQPKTKGKKKMEATTTINTEEEAEKIAKEIRKSHVKKKRNVQEVDQTRDAYHRFTQL